MKRKTDKVFLLFEIMTLVLMLASFNFYYFWHLNQTILSVAYIVLAFLMNVYKPYFKYSDRNVKWFALFLAAGILQVFNGKSIISSSIIFFINAIPLVLVLSLRDVYKKQLLSFIINSLAVIVGLSLLGWILMLIGVKIPGHLVEFGAKMHGRSQYVYSFHYLYMIIYRGTDVFTISRFCSLFLEPGYNACLSCLCLMINGFTLKKKANIVFLVNIVFSFSLAGYLLVVLSYLMYIVLISKKKTTNILCIIAALFLTFNLISEDMRDMFETKIIERLEFNKRTGQISGYNRFSSKSDKIIEDMGVADWLFGSRKYNDRAKSNINDVNYSSYIYRYGLLSFGLYLCFLAFPLFHNHNKKRSVQLTILYTLIICQTFYGMYWLMYPALYTLAMSKLAKEREIKATQKKAHTRLAAGVA